MAGGTRATSQPRDDGAGYPAPGLDAKKKSLKAQEQDPQAQDPQARQEWRDKAALWARETLVFVDECGINIGLSRLFARSPRGERAPGVVPRNRGKNTTILAALSWTGVQGVMSLEGATDTLAFEALIAQVLVPTLQPGQIVILDNLSAHKSLLARQLVEEKGCFWEYLPTYSPDLNPIELMWSRFKSHLRALAPRTQTQVDDLIWPLLETVTPKHAQAWFKHAGYI